LNQVYTYIEAVISAAVMKKMSDTKLGIQLSANIIGFSRITHSPAPTPAPTPAPKIATAVKVPSHK